MVRAAGLPAVAVNNGYEYAPWAAILYAADLKWWENYWQRGKLGGVGAKDFQGLRVTIQREREKTFHPDILLIGNGGSKGFDDRLDYVRTGWNSAIQATHIAVHAGAKKILLLGCDCTGKAGRSHSFGVHAWRNNETQNRLDRTYESFIEGWGNLAPELAKRNVEVVNCSPISAINFFPKSSVQEALAC
ncbi:MAG: hypothetical protein WBK55_08215 [Alphaproteobacteria bacterium]